MSHKDYAAALKKFRHNEISIRDNYTAVFHLVTTAKGAPQFYTCENNPMRRETLAQAIDADDRTMAAWVDAPHLRVIDNSGADFNAKIKRLTDEVFAAIGLPVPIETEKKYLIARPDAGVLGKLGAVKSEILQTYLSDIDGKERRIRQRGGSGSYSYFYTEKQNIIGRAGGRIEYERKISQNEYLQLLLDGVKHLRKDRYCFVYNSQYFELDIFPGWPNRALLELELTDANQNVNIPKVIKVIREVTNEAEFKNATLAAAGTIAVR